MKVIIKSNNKDEDKLSLILKELRDIKNDINMIKSKLNDKEENNIINLKKEVLNLDMDYLVSMLNHRSHLTEINIFKKYYMDGLTCPVKIEGVRKILIYMNDNWILDMNGKILTDILCMNIQRTLTGVNVIDNIENMEKFLENQLYINKFNDYKYRREVYKSIINYITCNISSTPLI